MTKSSKKSGKTQGPLRPSSHEDITHEQMPRTQQAVGTYPTDHSDDQKNEQSTSSTSSTSSQSSDGKESHTDSLGESNLDHEDAGSVGNSMTSSKSKRRRRSRKNNKKDKEEKESKEEEAQVHKESEQESGQQDEGNQLLQHLQQMNANIFVISDQIQALTNQVNEHSKVLSSKEKTIAKQVNPYLQQLAHATEDVHWRDILQPRTLHVEDLSADNNQVDRSDNNVVGRSSLENNNSPVSNTSPLNKNIDPSNNIPPPNRLASSANTKDKASSYLSRVYDELDNSTLVASRNQVVIMRQEKECNVRINRLELGTVANAVRKIKRFQEREQTVVNMMKVLDDSVQDYLKLKYKVSPQDFCSWKVSDLMKIMANETTVTGVVPFYDQLKSAIRNKDLTQWSTVNPQNHETFYLEQVRFIDEFRTIFKLMLTGNARHCPQTNLKRYGLLSLFKELNNPSYFDHIYNGPLKQQKYNNMYDFLDAYLKAIHDHYQLSIVIKDLPYEFNKQLKQQGNSHKQDAYYQSKRNVTKQLDQKTNYKFNKSSNYANKFNSQRSSSGSNYRDRKELNHITSAIDEDDEQDIWRNVGPEGQTQDYQDEDSVSVASNETKSDIDEDDNDQEDNIANTADDDFDQQLAAMEGSNHLSSGKNNTSNSNAPYACLKKILTGKCEKPNCPYDHNPHRLREAAQDVASKASNYLKTSSSKQVSNKPSALMVRDKGKFN